MHTEDAIMIKGTVDRIFAYAAATENWPLLLPHYRRVDVLADHGHGQRVVEMVASRDGFPCSWRSIQIDRPTENKIIYKHIRGVTTGMYVEWILTPADPTPGAVTTVKVEILHDLVMSWPLIGSAVANHILGPLFVHNIASKTLASIKRLVEAELAGEPVTPIG